MHIWRMLFDRMMGWRTAREKDFERELRTDLELEAEEQQDEGVSAEEARYAARRTFGDTTLVTEDVREAWGWTWLERLIQDTRFGLRQLGNSAGSFRGACSGHTRLSCRFHRSHGRPAE